MKKIFPFLIAFMACISAVNAEVVEKVKIGDLYYNLDTDSKTAEVAKDAYEDLAIVTIPSSVPYNDDNYDVTGVGKMAFYSCKTITSVTIPDGMVSIGSSAFCYCSNLESIELGNTLQTIENGAFFECTKLKTITIPSTIKSIGSNVFYGCKALTSALFDNCAAALGEAIFSHCSNLSSVQLGNSIISIGNNSFYECYKLVSIDVPSTVVSIGNGAFTSVPNISYTGSESSPYNWGARCLNGYVDGWFIYGDESKTILKACSASAMGEIQIPGSVTEIDRYAFMNCKAITSVQIPNSVTIIGEAAFQDCSGLVAVILSNSITSIPNSAFAGCSSLTSVTIPVSVTTIGNYAFGGCSSLETINIPENVTSIGDQAFYDCTNLSNINIPDNVTDFGGIAFYGTNLSGPLYNSHTFIYMPPSYAINEYTIPDGIKTIANSAFEWCQSINTIHLPNTITYIGERAFSFCIGLTSFDLPNSVQNVGNGAFYRCDGLMNAVYNDHLLAYVPCNIAETFSIPYGIETIANSVYEGCESLTAITIPESVKSIGDMAFFGCSNLASLTIPTSVTYIGSEAFGVCSSLTSVSLPDNVVAMGVYSPFESCNGLTEPVYNAHVFAYMPTTYSGDYKITDGIETIVGGSFTSCKNITSIDIPSSVTFIGRQAFDWTSGLTSVTCRAIVPPAFDDITFAAVDNSIPLYVPAKSVKLYKEAFGWKRFTNIQPIPAEPEPITDYTVNYFDKDKSIITSEVVTLDLPDAPSIEGFTFVKWKVLASDLTEGINIQAVYTYNGVPTEAPSVYVNPANSAQKLIRNGNIYILSGDKTYTITGQDVK